MLRSFALLFVACAPAFAAPASLAVYPSDVRLATARDRQAIVVQATYADGITRDVTSAARLTFSKPGLVRLDGTTLVPAGDGACELRVEFEGKAVAVPVTVKDAAAERPISFKRDVMPV